MGIRINTNMLAVNAQRNLRGTKLSMEKTSEKLSSGNRINKSADDAAGLAISDNLGGQIRSFQQASRNAQDGISFVQVAEGGISEVSNMVIRMRELSVQAASDTIGDKERNYLDGEVQQLKLEIQRIAQSTQYNGTHLLDGTGGQLEVQVGIRNDSFLDRIGYDASKSNISLASLGLEGIGLTSKKSAQEGLALLDNSISVVNANRATLGALQNRLISNIANTDVTVENYSAAKSRIKDADFANESAEMARVQVMMQAGLSVLSQANQSQGMALKLLG